MTTITVADGYAFVHSKLDLSLTFTADLTERLPTGLQFALNATTQLRLTGAAIVYDRGGHPTDGLITGIQGTADGAPAFTLTGAQLAWATSSRPIPRHAHRRRASRFSPAMTRSPAARRTTISTSRAAMTS